MSGITVVPFRRELAGDFRRLNLDWIERLFAVEAADRKVLDDPEAAIVAKGGMIFFAIDGETVVGTAAIIRFSDVRFELAKMAVADTVTSAAASASCWATPARTGRRGRACRPFFWRPTAASPMRSASMNDWVSATRSTRIRRITRARMSTWNCQSIRAEIR